MSLTRLDQIDIAISAAVEGKPAEPVIQVFDDQEFRDAQFEYQRAQMIMATVETDGFRHIAEVLTQRAQIAAALSRNTPPGHAKESERKLQSYVADQICSQLQSLIVDCRETPRPVKVRRPQ
jgi:hypothetical protein